MATLFINDVFARIDAFEARPNSANALVVSPRPKREQYQDATSNWKCTSSLDLHLGCYFLIFNRSNLPALELGTETLVDTLAYQTQVFVPVGSHLILQPGEFLLGATLEWLRLPMDCSAYVVGRSGLGRTGIIIETAGMIHPEFNGCLTLEISNLSGIPIYLYPGMGVCQVVFHTSTRKLPEDATFVPRLDSTHIASRRPKFGRIAMDRTIHKLKEEYARQHDPAQFKDLLSVVQAAQQP